MSNIQSFSEFKGDFSVGLVANGSSKSWDVAVDHTTTAPERWFIQLESRSLYLYFEIEHPRVIDRALSFVERRLQCSKDVKEPSKCVGSNEELTLGNLDGLPIALLGDGEYSDRCFIMIGKSPQSCCRFSIIGDDLRQLLTALRQVSDELKSEDLVDDSSA